MGTDRNTADYSFAVIGIPFSFEHDENFVGGRVKESALPVEGIPTIKISNRFRCLLVEQGNL